MYYLIQSRLVFVSIVVVNCANAHFDSPTLTGRCYPSNHVLVSVSVAIVNRADVHFASLTACLYVLRRDQL
jgi:hypothetical protein